MIRFNTLVVVIVYLLIACSAEAGPWDGTVQPFRITVPSLDTACGTLDSLHAEPDTDRVTIILEADGVWRRFYRQYELIARDSTLLVNDWQIPAGWWKCKVTTLEPGSSAQCQTPPFGRISAIP